MNIRIGSAPDSWGVWFGSDPRQTPWQRFMDEIAEAGYEWTELGPYGYLPTDVPTLRAELDKRGLKVSGTFLMTHFEKPELWQETEAQALKTGELLANVGAGFMVLIDDVYSDLFSGQRTMPAALSDAEFGVLSETANKIGSLIKREFGLTAVFHPHAETHVEYEHQIEKLIEQTDPALVSICIDTGHHAYRGGDPVAFIRKHHARIPYLHLKSVDTAMQKKVEEEDIPFAIAVGQDMFVEPAAGAVDFLALRDLLQELNFDGWGIVEQDMFPAPFDKPFPIAKRTRQYLRDIGMG